MKKAIDSKKLLFENMEKINPGFKAKEVMAETEVKKEVIAEDKKWIQKAVNPEHKGYCTPMTKPTCTPERKALAKRFKKGIEDEGVIKEEMVYEGSGLGSPIHKWVMFGYNFPSDFIEQAWQDEQNTVQHLKPKFDSLYKQYGADAVMNRFYAELDGSNQQKLENWVLANYKG